MATRLKSQVGHHLKATSAKPLFASIPRSGATSLQAMAENTSVDQNPGAAEVQTVATTTPSTPSASATIAKPASFAELQPNPKGGTSLPVAPLMDVNLKISVILGETEMSLGDLLKLGEGSIIELNNSTGEPIQILVNNRLYAKGDIVVVEDVFGVRISEILDPQKKG